MMIGIQSQSFEGDVSHLPKDGICLNKGKNTEEV